ncbi:hypothetical protein [Leptolyngbya ohadii]|uniref:hypothetical protein n=1 Tax=Leptolyngbya ohadii TaxID=1962290 RepID=UPI000B5A0BFD|nr:hypothetical protein [Leptolyngbya ohadii]
MIHEPDFSPPLSAFGQELQVILAFDLAVLELAQIQGDCFGSKRNQILIEANFSVTHAFDLTVTQLAQLQDIGFSTKRNQLLLQTVLAQLPDVQLVEGESD